MSNQEIALFDKIHPIAVEKLKESGFKIAYYDKTFDESKLDLIENCIAIGIRSKSKINAKILKAAKKLRVIGCFCIGYNQVDIGAASNMGIPIFNSPYSNTRSVAELVIGSVIMLMRGVIDKNRLLHQGHWFKTSKNAYEVRGKVLGIIGYGNIGIQVGYLAEALGMQVVYHDSISQLSLGNAKPLATMDELLEKSDVVTVHVPALSKTSNMIAAKELKKMKKGSFLINYSRSGVVNTDDLVQALKSKHLGGVAIDVFPKEPESSIYNFSHPLQNLENVILTPHIAGSTQESQYNIGLDVSNKLQTYLKLGGTVRALNFPQIQSNKKENTNRLINIHKNLPGKLNEINKVFSNNKINIVNQILQTKENIGYLIIDIDIVEKDLLVKCQQQINKIKDIIKTEILY